jgi:hypothetical protein
MIEQRLLFLLEPRARPLRLAPCLDGEPQDRYEQRIAGPVLGTNVEGYLAT